MNELMTQNDIRSVLDTLPHPVILVNKRRRMMLLNAAAQEEFAPGLEGQDFVLALRSPEALRCVDQVLFRAPSAETTIHLNVPVRKTLKLSVVRPKNAQSLDFQAVVSILDISHVLKAEQMRSDFVANVSHELRSPLTSLTGIIETLKDAAKDDAAARQNFLDIMSREAGRMNRLIGDLLSLSKVEVNAHVRPAELVDLPKLVEQSVATFASYKETAPPDLRVEALGPIPPIPGDADELTQVIHNLFENAVKYGGEGTPVVIRLIALDQAPGFRGKVVSLSVSDQGAGIAAHHIPRLTERFYRIDEGRSREQGGTGLGLAIVKHIVNRHLGRLHIESEVGAGTTFTVHLPVA